MKRIYIAFATLILILLGSFSTAQAATSVFQTFQGGTGTSSPSGILYGDNGATSHLNTVSIGSNLTFSGGILSATGGGPGGASSTIQFNSNGVFNGTNLFTDGTNLGIGTATPTTFLTIRGTTASDGAAPSGIELINTGNWTVPGDWTTSDNITFQHTASGGTGVLSNAVPILTNHLYAVTFTLANRTTSSVNVAMGGITVSNANTSNTTQTFYAYTTSSAALTFTPAATTWNGSVASVSVQEVLLPPAINAYDSTGALSLSAQNVLASGGNTSYGVLAGATLNIGGSAIDDTFYGFQAGMLNDSQQGNTYIGWNAGKGGTTLSSGIRNTVLGVQGLTALTSANDNSTVGWNAGANITSGGQNTIVGRSAGGSISTQAGVSCLGYLCGDNLSTSVGARNSGLGWEAISNITTGLGNTGVGYSAGLNLNTTSASTTVTGALAGTGPTVFISNRSSYYGAGSGAKLSANSDDNAFFGNSTGLLNTSGNDNSLFGSFAGQNLTTGMNNILIGYNALATTSSATNFLNIGNTLFGILTATSSNATIPASTGSIGIGTTSPWGTFAVAIGSTTPGLVVGTAGSSSSALFVGSANSGSFVGIATSSPWRTFDVNGTVGLKGLTTGAGAGALCLDSNNQVVYSAGAGCTGSGTLTAVSVATANGFAGSSAGGTTPSLTLSITITGLLKGNGTAISAATAGVDYLASYDAFTHAANNISSATTSAIGVGTTTPWAQLSISTSTQSSPLTPLFAVASTTNTTIFGVFGSGNVGVASTTPWRTLGINGTVSFSGLTAGAGAGALCLSSSNEVVYSAGAACTGGGGGSSFAYPFTPSTDGGVNTSATSTALEDTHPGLGLDVAATSWYGIGGTLFAYATTTNFSTIVGLGAGGGSATTSASAQYTTAFGYNALHKVTAVADEDTAIGYSTLAADTSGTNNTALGYQTAINLIGGGENTSIGQESLFTLNSNGFDNTSVGMRTLYLLNSSGSRNTALGTFAGQNQTAGSGNIVIGAYSDLPSLSGSAQLNIGNTIYGTGIYNAASLTNSSYPSANSTVGIASSTPWAEFSISALAGSAYPNGSLFLIASSTSIGTTTLFIIKNTGNVGIGTTTPQAILTTVAASSTVATTAYTGLVSIIAGLENTTTVLFQEIDQFGHLITSGDAPTVTGGTSSVSGNDRNGNITITGTALTSITLTFAHPYITAPDCTESDTVLAVATDITSISTTQVVFGFGVGGVTSGNLWYQCVGHQ